MTIGSPDPVSGVPTAVAAEPKPNPFARIVGVLFSPGETFQSIARRPDWVVPLLLIMVISLVSGVLIAQRVDFNALAREAMESNPQTAQIPADRLESMVKFTAITMRVSAYASPFLSILVLAISSGVLLLAFRLFGGEGNFKQAFSATTYAWYPRLIKGVLGTIVLMTKQSPSIWDLQSPLRSNLGFLFDPKTQPVQFALASSVDAFTIWSVILLIIGFAALSRLSRARSAAIVISLWVVINIVLLIGPAMQSIRSRT